MSERRDAEKQFKRIEVPERALRGARIERKIANSLRAAEEKITDAGILATRHGYTTLEKVLLRMRDDITELREEFEK